KGVHAPRCRGHGRGPGGRAGRQQGRLVLADAHLDPPRHPGRPPPALTGACVGDDPRSGPSPAPHRPRAGYHPFVGADLLIPLVIVLVLVVMWRGPKTLPKLGEAFGRGVKEAKTEAAKAQA